MTEPWGVHDVPMCVMSPSGGGPVAYVFPESLREVRLVSLLHEATTSAVAGSRTSRLTLVNKNLNVIAVSEGRAGAGASQTIRNLYLPEVGGQLNSSISSNPYPAVISPLDSLEVELNNAQAGDTETATLRYLAR